MMVDPDLAAQYDLKMKLADMIDSATRARAEKINNDRTKNS